MDIRRREKTDGGGSATAGGLRSEAEEEDYKKCVAAEMEALKQTADAKKIPVSKTKKPTPEHLMLREAMEHTMMWEKAMYAKCTEGQFGEILDRVMHYMTHPEFPNEPFHKWTDDLMEDAKTGWRKFKALQELFDKYPQQNMEQEYRDDTGDWIMLDV